VENSVIMQLKNRKTNGIYIVIITYRNATREVCHVRHDAEHEGDAWDHREREERHLLLERRLRVHVGVRCLEHDRDL